MSNYLKQVQKSVEKFFQVEDPEKIAFHEAGHLLMFRNFFPESKPFITILHDGGVGTDFKGKKPDMKSDDYILCTLAGYAAELVWHKTTERAVIEGAVSRLLTNCKIGRNMGFFSQCDDFKAWYLMGYPENAESIFKAAFTLVIGIIEKNKSEFLKYVEEVKNSGKLEKDNKDYSKVYMKIA